MPTKPGNGGHGQEAYDPSTGKYVGKDTINNEKQAESLFGIDFDNSNKDFLSNINVTTEKNYFDGSSEVKDPFDDGNNVVEPPEHIILDNTGSVLFTSNEDVERYIKEVCEKIAWRSLLKRDKDIATKGYKEVKVGDKVMIINSPESLYNYYNAMRDEIDLKSLKYHKEYEIDWNAPKEERINRVLNKLGLASVDELVERYNQLSGNRFKMGDNAKKERKVVITTGLPASGKSITGQKNDILSGVEIDSDLAKELFPEYVKDKTMISVVHDMSAVIRDAVLEEAIKKGYNVSLPTVGGKENMKYFLKLFGDNGYDVQVANVEIPFEQNVARSITRTVETGRLTDFNVIARHLGAQKKIYNDLIRNFELNGKSSGITGFATIDNTIKHKIVKSKGFNYPINEEKNNG